MTSTGFTGGGYGNRRVLTKWYRCRSFLQLDGTETRNRNTTGRSEARWNRYIKGEGLRWPSTQSASDFGLSYSNRDSHSNQSHQVTSFGKNQQKSCFCNIFHLYWTQRTFALASWSTGPFVAKQSSR